MDENTIRWLLTDTTVDPVSKVPVSAVVFMLYYGFELKHFLLNISKDIVENYNPEVRDYGSTSLYLAGSAAQGFYLNTNDFLDARDIDIVSIVKTDVRKECQFDKKQVYDEKQEERRDRDNARNCKESAKENVTMESPPFYLNVETWDDTYPGYVMLRKCRKDELPVQTSLSHRYVSSAETAKSRTEYWNEIQSVLADIFRSGIDDEWGIESLVYEDVESQGPAASSMFTNIYLDVQLNADLVFALPYPGWPEIAEEWRNRKTFSGWPELKMKQDIVESGCLIVPKGQRGSRAEDYEWRISFSLAELKLARSLNSVQREIVHVLKALISDRHEEGYTGIEAKLDSYFVINLLYKEIEESDINAWTEQNIAEIIFRILDKLVNSIKNKNLPHYFIPQNNLLHKYTFPSVKLSKGEFTMGYFDEMMDTDEYIDFALYTAMRARYDPLNQILLQKKYVQLSGAIRSAVFDPLVKQAKSSTKVEGKMYLMTVLRLAKAHFVQFRFKDAYTYIEDTLKFQVELKDQELPENVCNEIQFLRAVCSYLVGAYESAMKLFEEVEHNPDRVKQMSTEQTHAYYVYFVRSCLSLLKRESNTENKFLPSKIELIINEATKSSPTLYLELVNYFMVSGRYQEADAMLIKVKDSLEIEDINDIPEKNSDDKRASGDKQTECEMEEIDDSLELQVDFSEYSTTEESDKIVGAHDTCTINNMDDTEEVQCNLIDKGDQRIDEQMETTEEDENIDKESNDIVERPLLDRHDNQDLLNQYALIQAFKNLGLEENAENTLQKLKKKVLVRQGENKDITIEALDHDYTLYMSYKDERHEQDDLENPMIIFKDQIIFTTGDNLIIDDILKSVVECFGYIRLSPRDLYFHYRIQRLKNAGKLSEALALVEQVKDQDLVVSHLKSLGKDEMAEDASFYARLDRDGGGRSVADTLKQWIERLLEAARKYELKNVYLDSVFE